MSDDFDFEDAEFEPEETLTEIAADALEPFEHGDVKAILLLARGDEGASVGRGYANDEEMLVQIIAHAQMLARLHGIPLRVARDNGPPPMLL